MYVIAYVIVLLCVMATVNLTGLEDNLFYKAHIHLHGNRTVCYPLTQSVEALFVATPGWTPHDLYTVDTSDTPCKGQIGKYKRGLPGRCVGLVNPTTPTCEGSQKEGGEACPDTASYPLCFTGQGWGCAYALVPKNDSCIQTQCVRQHCRINKGKITCICDEQKCLNITAGRQLICGQCNGTHVSSAKWAYPFDTYQVVGSNGKPKKLNNWQYEQTHNQGTTCYRAKKGYVFLFNGTYMTETPNLPNRFAVGTIGPLTVPCPQKGYIRRRIVTRAISREFCADWEAPGTLGSSLGYGFLGALSLGGSAGVIGAKNRNHIVCGLTILGNSTSKALEAVNQEMAELRLYAQQTRYAVDYQLAQQGGVCAIIGDKCITHVTDESYNITQVINDIRAQLNNFRQGPKKGGSWLAWLMGESWESYLLHGLIILIVIIIVCCLTVGCLKACFKIMLTRIVPGASVRIEDEPLIKIPEDIRRNEDTGRNEDIQRSKEERNEDLYM